MHEMEINEGDFLQSVASIISAQTLQGKGFPILSDVTKMWISWIGLPFAVRMEIEPNKRTRETKLKRK